MNCTCLVSATTIIDAASTWYHHKKTKHYRGNRSIFDGSIEKEHASRLIKLVGIWGWGISIHCKDRDFLLNFEVAPTKMGKVYIVACQAQGMCTRAVKEYSRVRVLASPRETRESESRSKDSFRTRHTCSIQPTGTRVPASPFEGVPGSWNVGLLPALVCTQLTARHLRPNFRSRVTGTSLYY